MYKYDFLLSILSLLVYQLDYFFLQLQHVFLQGLFYNNQVYYYSRLLNGKKPETTIWMRFVLGKIRRELEKNRWSYLSERMIGTVKNRIDGILSRVQTSFSIIRRIQVSDFEVDYSNYKINLSIETWISDLIDNHKKLDITINYKNYNNS